MSKSHELAHIDFLKDSDTRIQYNKTWKQRLVRMKLVMELA